MLKDLSDELATEMARREGLDRTKVEETAELYRVVAERFYRGDANPFGFRRS